MKIAMFTDTYFPQINGVTYTISLWKKRLEEKGHQVKIFFPNSDYEPDENEIPLKSISLPFYDGYKIGFPEKIRSHLKDVDVIHTHTPFSLGAMGAYYSKKLNVPKITSFHTPPEEYINYLPGSSVLKYPLIPIYHYWEKKFMSNANVVTAPSKVIKERLEKKGIKNAYILKNGVNREFFSPTEKDLDIETDSRYIIGYSGRHGKEKNLSDLIEVAENLNNIDIIIGGDGPHRKEYEKMARDIDNIHFLGFLEREKLPTFYSTLDVFVFPSLTETQGLVGLEANACGTPIVGANKKALKETIKEGVNGYKYEPGNIEDLEEKIKMVLNNKDSLAKKSLDYSKKHSIDKTIEELTNHYKRIWTKDEAKELLN